jgi:hypothetical protein
MRGSHATLGVLVLGITIVTAREAAADFKSGKYLSHHSNGSSQTDPRNLVFYDDASVQGAVLHAKHHDSRWGQHGSGPAWFKDHSGWDPTDDYLTTGGALTSVMIGETRDHIRIENGDDADTRWGSWMHSAIHHEMTTICILLMADVPPRPVPIPAHAVMENGFDGPRDNLVRLFQPSHGPETWEHHNNKTGSQQCDGRWPHSLDGRVAFIAIP